MDAMAIDPPAAPCVHPSSPICFKSLPMELRASVIESFGESLDGHPADLATLRALSLVDRESSKFATSVLWRHVEFHSKSNEQLEIFLQHVAPHRRSLVRSADLGGAYQRAPTDEEGVAVMQNRFQLYMRLVEALPAISALDIKALPFTNPILVVTAPTLWNSSTSSLRSLTLSGYPRPLIDGDTLAVVFDRFPLLSRLSLTLIGGCINDSFAESLRRLGRLVHLELRNCECVDERLLDGTWTAEIKELVVSDCWNLSWEATTELMRRFAPTLEMLDLLLEHAPTPPSIVEDASQSSSDNAPPPTMAPFSLPSLRTLTFEIHPTPPYTFLSSFLAPHLSTLTLHHPSTDPSDLHIIYQLLERSKALRRTRFRIPRSVLVHGMREEDVERLHTLFEARGVEPEWEAVEG